MRRLPPAFAYAGPAIIAGLLACSDNAVAPAPRAAPGAPAFAAAGSGAASVARVTTNADAGPGSFRAAVDGANADASITLIRFAEGLDPILLGTTVAYTGEQPLEIVGAGAEIDATALPARAGAIVLGGGGDVIVRRLAVRDAPGVGITVQIPDDATGIVAVTLVDVRVQRSGLHGVLVNDQSGYLVDPLSTSSDGSAAAVRVRVVDSRFVDNGTADIDQDGLRVNEGGAGVLDAEIRRTVVAGSGGDGIELDERGPGSVVFTVIGSTLTGNGAFSAEDYDDGIDVDESGPGDLDGRFVDVTANDNFEQGIDLNENDAGDLRVVMDRVQASGNGEEGVEFEEDDDVAGGGDIVAELRDVTTRENGANGGDAGLKLREKGAGRLDARLDGIVASDNAIGGILLREDAGGALDAVVVDVTANDNAGDGIAFDENGAGGLDGRVRRATASDNTGAGVAAEQAAPGSGTLRVRRLTAERNADGAVRADEGVVVERNDAPPTIAGLRVDPATGPIRVSAKACGGRYTTCLRFEVASTAANAGPFQLRVDWGDGTAWRPNAVPAAGVALVAPHDYTRAGDYTATVVLTDRRGAEGTASVSLRVEP